MRVKQGDPVEKLCILPIINYCILVLTHDTEPVSDWVLIGDSGRMSTLACQPGGKASVEKDTWRVLGWGTEF